MECNLCGSKKHRNLFRAKDLFSKTSGKEFTLVRCQNCGLVFLNPPPSPEELKNAYPENSPPHDDLRVENGHPPAAKKIQEDKKIFLDFGCGAGKFLEYQRAKHPGWEFAGLETNAAACERARKKGFEIFCGTLSEAGYQSDFFDIIVLRHVLEHLEDPRKTLKELRKILKPGGMIQITVPNFNGISIKLFKSRAAILEIPRHLFHFTPETLSRMLQEKNYQINKIKFDSSARSLARSIGFLFGKSWVKPPGFLMQLLRPASKLAQITKSSDVFNVTAEKPLL